MRSPAAIAAVLLTAALAPAADPEIAATHHQVRANGQILRYTAHAGLLPIRNNDAGDIHAHIFFVACILDRAASQPARPLTFVWNGGPGANSTLVHLSGFGPRRLKSADDPAVSSPPPAALEDNDATWLEFTDLVFVDPVGTGFSHAVGKAQNKDFWGVDSDVKSLAQFIQLFITRNNRWNSPKFLIGESYGTFRSAALGDYLQAHDNIYLNGIVLISSVLDLGTISFYPGVDSTYVYYLPSYAATAWYHKVLPNRPDDVNAFVEDARKFAQGEFATALMKGTALSDSEKSAIAKKMAAFTGLSEDYLIKANLRVNLFQFMKELQRSRGLTTGRLDARFTGPTYDLLGEFAEYDPQETAISGAFVAAFNSYVREDLKFGADKTYLPAAEFNGAQWDWKHQNPGDQFGFPGSPNVEADLVEAMISNPHLKIEVENGIYDLATPFLATEQTMDHLGIAPNLRKNITLKYYDAGHMMYVRDEDLSKLKANVAAFLDSAKP